MSSLEHMSKEAIENLLLINPELAERYSLGGVMLARQWVEEAIIKGSDDYIIQGLKRIYEKALADHKRIFVKGD